MLYLRKELAQAIVVCVMVTNVPAQAMVNYNYINKDYVVNKDILNKLGYNKDIKIGESIASASKLEWNNSKNKSDDGAPIINMDMGNVGDMEYMEYSEEFESYFLYTKIDALRGEIIDDSEIISLGYKVYSGNLKICDENITPSKNFSINDMPLMVGANIVTISAEDSYGNKGSKTIKIFNLSYENMGTIELDKNDNDNDNDGLMNYEELFFGTDMDNEDTDNDGLTDYDELIITDTDPLKVDTDLNGILDGEEDFDEDGLNNINEMRLNGNPYNDDTDFDGLKDGEEKLIGTKLDEYDTDDDGIEDIQEIELNINPLNPDTDGNGIMDGDEIFTVIETPSDEIVDPDVVPSIEIELRGELIKTLHMYMISEDNIYLPKEMPGYLGEGCEIDLGDKFNGKATLTYKFNSEFLNREEFKPAIYYFDVENQELVLLENQTVDLVNCTVSAPITQLSSYILLDKTEFDKAFEREIKSLVDTDGDGLSDYEEEALVLFNGIIIQTDPNNPDTDGDGLLDGEEVYPVMDKNNNIHHYKMYANPNNPDTDGDGLLDGPGNVDEND